MKTLTKQKIWKTAIVSWILIGILILINVIFWWIKLITSDNIALILILSVFFGYSIIALVSYVAITLLFLLIKGLRKIRKK